MKTDGALANNNSIGEKSFGHLDTDGTGVDGSGAIAIKMVHTDTNLSIIADVLRLIFSICLLLFSTGSVFYAIAISNTTMPSSLPSWAQYICLFFCLFILGVMEGVQIGVVELAHKDPNKYRKRYPRAAKLLALENKGRNVERFLLGRQVLVVMTVFVAARITTFEGFWEEIHALSYSGFLGVILVVVVAQLTPQVLAAAYPVEFLNLPGIKVAFWACLIVEATGLVHAVWFLCVVAKSVCGACICRHSVADDDYAFERVASRSPENMDVVGVSITKDMSKVAGQAEEDIEVEVALKTKEMDKERTGCMSMSSIDNEMATLIEHAGNNADFYYIGDDNFMSPAQCFGKFKKAGLMPPNFLLPPEHKDHIPPHIVAMMLLKMYTEQNAQQSSPSPEY